MAKRHDAGAYWLAVVARGQGETVLEAEEGYKPCAHPGRHRVMCLPMGAVCPGCKRVCRVPAVLGLQKDDEIVVLGKDAHPNPYDGGRDHEDQ